MIALGWVTYNRPHFLAPALYSAQKLARVVDRFYLVDDGSDPKHHAATQTATIYGPRGLSCCWCPTNRGVAAAKNTLVGAMLRDGADWVILAEDDITVLDERAVTGYIEACEESGWSHLSFHGHGTGNPTPVEVDGSVTYWPSYVGAWAIYHRSCFETVGLFDERFVNAWEHVEHTLRLSLAGLHPLPENRQHRAADATGSENWLAEIPGSLEHSVIRNREDWTDNVLAGEAYWREAHPDSFRLIWP